MIKTCNGEYWQYMESMKPAEAPCGRTFDDEIASTLCPHDELPPKLTHAELMELAERNSIKLPFAKPPTDDVAIIKPPRYQTRP